MGLKRGFCGEGMAHVAHRLPEIISFLLDGGLRPFQMATLLPQEKLLKETGAGDYGRIHQSLLLMLSRQRG